MNRIELTDRIARMWAQSRSDAGVSQDYVAKALGVSKKTVQNWECGEGSPNFRMALEWFDALGVPMYPYLMCLLYPEEIERIDTNTDINDLRRALSIYVDELDDLHAKELLFLLHGGHGSSPTGTLDVVTAYLHLPLAMRICVTSNMIENFKMADVLGFIKNEEHVLPKMETLERCVATAKEAVKNGKESYTLTEGGD